MIEYAVRNADDVEYSLNGDGRPAPAAGSLTFLEEPISFDQKVVEKSGRPGSARLGETRTESRRITLEYTVAGTDVVSELNEMIRALRDAVYLVDKTNERRIPIAVSSVNPTWDSGSHKLSGEVSATIQLLEPFWEGETEETASATLAVDVNAIEIVNGGYAPAPPVLTFTASAAVSTLEIYIAETKQGIRIDDPLFGTLGYETLVLDCAAGTLMLGDLDRTPFISPGTGFFDFPEGTSELRIVPTAACSVAITWRERAYV
jgi:hypothetical protein